MGILYVVSTPIGNTQDLTFRAAQVLKESRIIACEDTRHTKQLLDKLDLGTGQKLISLFEENEDQRTVELLDLLNNGNEIALVSNAGTPTISDPGFKLVRECLKQKIKVVPVPGPSSVITALSVSGLPTDKFIFLGFLPKKESHKTKIFAQVKLIPATVIFFESPFRILKTLNSLLSFYGDIQIVIARELTKVFEEVNKDKISVLLTKYQNPKGEFVVLFNLPEQEKV